MKYSAQFRWFILILLFLATTILYIDRSALGILAPDLQKSIGWSEEQYGYINTAFMIAYAICFLVMGSIIDRDWYQKGLSAIHQVYGAWPLQPMPWQDAGLVSLLQGLAWRSDNRAIFHRPLKRWQSGFQRRNGPWQLEFLTEEPIWGPSWLL